MIDVLDRMRKGNPVPEAEAPAIEPVLARIEAEHRTSSTRPASPPAEQSPVRIPSLRWRYRLALVGVLASGGALALVLAQGSGQGLSILARAYAATNSSSSILYYVADSSSTIDGHTHDLARSRVWLLDGRVRELTEEASRGVRETVIEPHLFSNYDSERNQITRIAVNLHLPLKVSTLGQPGYTPAPFQNPISELRSWYSEGHLRLQQREIRAGVQYDVLTANAGSSSGSPRSTRVVIRADDFVPVEVETTTSIGGRFRLESVTRYSAFAHLPVNARTLALLRLAPHPGAKVEVRARHH